MGRDDWDGGGGLAGGVADSVRLVGWGEFPCAAWILGRREGGFLA